MKSQMWKTVRLDAAHKLDLNASNKGVLFYFTEGIDEVADIIDSGHILTSYAEPHMERSDDFTSGKSRFVSLTRSPETLTRFERWRYGLIIDSDKLLAKDYKARPYSYNYSLREIELTVWEYEDGRPATFKVDVDNTPSTYTLNQQQFDAFLKYFNELYDEDPPGFFVKSDYHDDCTTYLIAFSFNCAGQTQDRGIDSNRLPPIIHYMLKVSGYEAEERIYPKSKTPTTYFKADTPEKKKANLERGQIELRDSVIGVLVPDTAYTSKPCENFRRWFINHPMWVYSDPRKTPEQAEKLKMEKQQGIITPQLYRYPR